MSQPVSDAMHFEGFTLDPARGSLSGAAGEIKLRPKSFDVLCYLAGKAGRLVGKDELVGAVWGQAAVSDESVARCVSDIRAALGDGEGRIVATVPRRGYRFSGEIKALAKSVLTPKSGVQENKREVCVAVLPFLNSTGDPTEDSLAEGVAEEILNAMARYRPGHFKPILASSVYRRPERNLKQVGRELGARMLLKGRVQRVAGRLRINCQLVDATTEAHLWSEKFEAEVEAALELQDQVATRIALAIFPIVVAAELDNARRKPQSDWTGFDHYATAVALYYQEKREALFDVVEHLRQAIAMNPELASAHAMFASAAARMRQYGQWVDDNFLHDALCSVDRALALAPNNSGVVGTCACSVFFLNGDVERARILAEHAVALNSNDIAGWLGLAWAKAALGDIDEAKSVLDRCLTMGGVTMTFIRVNYASRLHIHTLEANHKERLEWAQRLLAHFPDSVLALCTAWDVAVLEARTDDAAKFSEDLSGLLPDSRSFPQWRNNFATRNQEHARARDAFYDRVEKFFYNSEMGATVGKP